MVFYHCLLVAVFVVVALLYEICKICTIHYAVTVNADPFHKNCYADILYITFFYSYLIMIYHHHLPRLPVNIPVPAIDISNLGIPFSTDSTRWSVMLPLLSKSSCPNI